MAIIKEEDIFQEQRKVNECIDYLKEDILEYNKYVASIEEVIDALNVYFNTTGGIKKIQELASIDLNTSILNKLGDDISDTTIDYNQVKKYLS